MNLWWLCVLAGVVLIGVEIIAPGFVVIWLGLAALVTALPVFLGAPAWVDLVVFGGTLLLFTTVGRRLAITKVFRGARAARTNAEAVIGETGVVLEKVDPILGTGKVRVGGEVWTATSDEGQAIDQSESVIVRGLKGVRLVVSQKEMK